MEKWKRISSIFALVTSIPFLIIMFAVIPAMLIVVAIAGGGDDENDEKFDVWKSVKDEVKTEEGLENDISTWLLSFTFSTKKGYTEENNREKIKKFIKNEMCVFDWKEDKDDDESIDRFLTLQEILDTVKYNLYDDDAYYEYVQVIKAHYMFEPQEEGDYPYPLEEFSITSGYGERPNPTGEGTTFHNGMDIASQNPYAPIVSISDGEVVMVNTSRSSLGNYVIIRYRDRMGKFYGVYGHMSGILVESGDDVEQGEVIGFQGGNPRVDPNPGNSTGRHLHFEIRKSPYSSSSSVDPAQYIM